jgi:hypothetical protein
MSSRKTPRPGTVRIADGDGLPLIEFQTDDVAEPGEVLGPLASLLLSLAESDRARVLPLRPPRDEEADDDQGEAKAG